MRPTFVLDVHDLDAAGKSYEGAVTPDWLRGALQGCGDAAPAGPDGTLDVRYAKTGNDVVVRGSVRAQLTAPCSRCLEPTPIDVEADLTLLLVPSTSPRAAFAAGRATAPDARGEEYELQAGDDELDTYDGDKVELDGFVREAILLELPANPLCSEGCQGIAPPAVEVASTGPSIDPRLAPLLKFQKKGN